MAAKPIAYKIEPGTHWWCTCGRTSHPPFCDGSHKGTGRQPLKFKIAEETHVYWTKSEITGNPPPDNTP